MRSEGKTRGPPEASIPSTTRADEITTNRKNYAITQHAHRMPVEWVEAYRLCGDAVPGAVPDAASHMTIVVTHEHNQQVTGCFQGPPKSMGMIMDVCQPAGQPLPNVTMTGWTLKGIGVCCGRSQLIAIIQTYEPRAKYLKVIGVFHLLGITCFACYARDTMSENGLTRISASSR
nr:hypothetical protein CFP56_32458 [Quercus suber]